MVGFADTGVTGMAKTWVADMSSVALSGRSKPALNRDGDGIQSGRQNYENGGAIVCFHDSRGIHGYTLPSPSPCGVRRILLHGFAERRNVVPIRILHGPFSVLNLRNLAQFDRVCAFITLQDRR